MDNELQLRAAICEVGRRLWQRGLVGGFEGNISCRLSPRQLLCTPSGISKGHLKPNDLLVIDLQGNPLRGGQPSSEIKMHLKVYKDRPDCNAIVHAHPPYATGLGLAGESIPDNVMPEAGMVLGSVALVPFAYPTTEEVPRALEPLLPDHKVFILSHHGALCLGKDLQSASYRMETLEQIAHTYWVARMMGGANPMPNEAFDRLLAEALNGSLD